MVALEVLNTGSFLTMAPSLGNAMLWQWSASMDAKHLKHMSPHACSLLYSFKAITILVCYTAMGKSSCVLKVALQG